MAEVHRCFDCKFAKWTLTAAGRLHPSGGGLCMWEYKPPAIAAAFKWGGLSRNFAPSPEGGWINRREPIAQCPVYQRRDAK